MANPERHRFFLDPPDADTLRKSKGLARPSRWRALGFLANLVWGECRSRGAAYYKTAISLPRKTSYCSCPSRKSPCAHALALVQLLDRQSHFFSQPAEAPPWVEERLATGRAGTSTALQRARAKSRQQEKRLQAMQHGMGQLREWLRDLIRHGLAAAYEQPDSFWEGMAAQMVDAKLGAVGRRLRAIPPLLQQPDWPGLLLSELGELYLLARAFEQRDQLPEPLRADVLRLSGWSRKKAQLVQGEQAPVEPWQVLSVAHRAEEQLQMRRTWLLGRRSDRYALLLDFAWGQASFEGQWAAGDWLLAGMVFYPGAYPQRALIQQLEEQHPAGAFTLDRPPVFRCWPDLLRHFAEALRQQPFLRSVPALVYPRHIGRRGPDWCLMDEQGQALPLRAGHSGLWPALAQSALAPVPVFGEWDGKGFSPLSLLVSGRAVAFAE